MLCAERGCGWRAFGGRVPPTANHSAAAGLGGFYTEGWSWRPAQASWQSLRAVAASSSWAFLQRESWEVVGGPPTDSPTQTIELKVPSEALGIVNDMGPGLGTADFSLPIVKPSSLV